MPSRRMGWAAVTWTCATLGLAVTGLQARAAETPKPLRVGERAYAEILAGEHIDLQLDGLPGARISISCSAWDGEALKPVLALTDPSGLPIDLSPFLRIGSNGSSQLVKKIELTSTGTYTLRVTGQGSTSGNFDIVLTGKYPKKWTGTSVIDAAGAEATVPVPALADDLLSMKVKAARRSQVAPVLRRFEDAGGTLTGLGSGTAVVATALTTGVHGMVVAGSGGTTGTFTYSVKVTRAKPAKVWRDVQGFLTRGSISGTLIVPGAPPIGAGKHKVAAKRSQSMERPVRGGEVIVSIPGATSADSAADILRDAMPRLRFEVLASLTERGPYLVRALGIGRSGSRRDQGRTRSIAKAVNALRAISWAEPNGILSSAREPNDARWPSQDDFRAMRIPEAWDTTTGSTSVVVAVVDSGIWVHPDLSGRMLPGYDFVSSTHSAMDGGGWDADPTDSDQNFHGTHVAGTIGAAANNRSGVAGVLWNARIVPIRVLGRDGRGTNFDIAAGIRWAAGLAVSGAPQNANPARVINLSLGGGFGQAVADAVDGALGANVVVVAAAGNDAVSTLTYPAALPGVIAVSAVAPDFAPASYSNFGTWISVSAPGGDSQYTGTGILSTYVDAATLQPTFRELDGTSMACPHVAGVAALVLSVKPTLTPTQLKSLLEATAQDLGPAGFDVDFGHGMVDAAAAIDAALGSTNSGTQIAVLPDAVQVAPGVDTATLYVRNMGTTPATLNGVSVSTKRGGNWLAASADGTALPATVNVSVERADLAEGAYDGTVTLALSSGTRTVPVRLVVKSPTDPGPIIVAAVNSEGLIQAQTGTSLGTAFAYTIGNLPAGDYSIVAYTDRDANGAISRVDEWYGQWPLLSDARTVNIATESMSATGVDFALQRYDALFDFEGAGGGSITGAIAVLILDGSTRLPIPGARVFVNNAQLSAITDEKGRAVLTGGFTGAQTLTVAADGYDTFTAVGCNAQYQSFTLSPRTPPTTDVTVTIHGLDWFDDVVFVQVGAAVDVFSYLSGTPSRTLTVSRGTREIPVWAFVQDFDGLPSKIALTTLDPAALGATANVDLYAYSPDDTYWYIEDTVVRRPTSGMDVASTEIYVSESIYFSATESLLIGINAIPHNTFSEVDWISFGLLDSELSASMVASAFDDFGRESHYVVNNTVDNLGFGAWITLGSPPIPTAPSSGATGLSTSPVIAFAPTAESEANFVQITDVVTGATWRIVVPGAQTSVTLPALPGDGLTNARGYTWRVSSYEIPGLNYHSYLDTALTTMVTAYSISEARSFSTQ